MKLDVWIGLAKLRPLRGSELDNSIVEASCNALASAETQEKFEARVRAHFFDESLLVVGLEDVERFQERQARCRLPRPLEALAARVAATGVVETDSMVMMIPVNGGLIDKKFYEENVTLAKQHSWQRQRFDGTGGEHDLCVVCFNVIPQQGGEQETAYRSSIGWMCGLCHGTLFG